MSNDPHQDPKSEAIEQLERFGLNTYAARTFVALASLGSGTARDVSQVAEVPRTRVYGAVEELEDRGLVDTVQSSPKQFWAISSETAGRTFEREFERRLEVLRTALSELEPTERRTEQRGIWTVEGRTAVTDRLLEFFDVAEERIVYLTAEERIPPELVEGLQVAADRGVSLRLTGGSTTGQEQLRSQLPDATVTEPTWGWSETRAGRLMIVDGQKVLVSIVGEGEGGTETAIWSEGASNSLVIVVKAIFDGVPEPDSPA
ncbi:TrmB family transcriptional regulator [Halolamina salina]|uniref:TrmB family transcriptional regulator n=1 Tax=Halolamina salina TaxID=1220023 RepID=A0ABD6B6N1_9EURY